MKTVFIISGYARSGKSTLTTYIESIGIPTMSSSNVLTDNTLRYYNVPVNDRNRSKIEEKGSENELWWSEVSGQDKSIAYSKIFVAEDVIVPVLGRDYFAISCVFGLTKKMRLSGCNLGVIFSTIKEERRLMLKRLPKGIKVVGINLRSDFEVIRNDARSLIDEREGIDFYTLYNNGSKQQLCDRAFKILNLA